MTERLDPRHYTLEPTPNPGIAVAHQLGLPYLVFDENGATNVFTADRAVTKERNPG